jgi:hypothetical protein
MDHLSTRSRPNRFWSYWAVFWAVLLCIVTLNLAALAVYTALS